MLHVAFRPTGRGHKIKKMKQKKIKVKKEKKPMLDYKSQNWLDISAAKQIPFRMLHQTHIYCKMEFDITVKFFWLCMN